ncbi:MAG: YebC/PmpR family DNA-binding transcriptional regulator [Terrimicrobiaceae bacterium]
MAGHSKWSKVKRSKGALDVKRGMLFSKLSKEILVAAKMGGGNPALNHRLRAAIESARAQSMPSDNIERAIKKATGELASADVEEITYEGYAPGGVALLVETATDNRNRTAADLRSIFTKNHGSLGGPGSVAYLFHRIGHVMLAPPVSEDFLMDVAVGAGAEDYVDDGDMIIVKTPPDRLYAVSSALRDRGVEPVSQKLVYEASTLVNVMDVETGRQVLRLCDALEENEDVLAVHSNFDLPDDLISRLQEY